MSRKSDLLKSRLAAQRSAGKTSTARLPKKGKSRERQQAPSPLLEVSELPESPGVPSGA